MFKKIIIIIIIKEKQKGSVGNPSKASHCGRSSCQEIATTCTLCHPERDMMRLWVPKDRPGRQKVGKEWTLDQWVRVQSQHPNQTDPAAMCASFSKYCMWRKLSHL